MLAKTSVFPTRWSNGDEGPGKDEARHMLRCCHPWATQAQVLPVEAFHTVFYSFSRRRWPVPKRCPRRKEGRKARDGREDVGGACAPSGCEAALWKARPAPPPVLESWVS